MFLAVNSSNHEGSVKLENCVHGRAEVKGNAVLLICHRLPETTLHLVVQASSKQQRRWLPLLEQARKLSSEFL